VKVLCAWCVRDGKPAFLREKVPLDDPGETHGLCNDHFTSLSAKVGWAGDSPLRRPSRLSQRSWNLIRWGQRMVGRFFPPC
jgi:hypothetical protein